MTTWIFSHDVTLEHDTGAGHPECPARIKAVLQALRDQEFAALQWHESPEASMEQLTRIHPRSYVDGVLAAIPDKGLASLDGDTTVSPRSGEAALRAAGAVCAGVDAVIDGKADNVFCAMRPPGHHAEPTTAMGFCLFSNAAIGAVHALSRGLERVAVVDFDVHHGNGTQAALQTRADCMYVSSHQSPLYPGTGRRSETGVGNILNVPLEANSGSAEIRYAWTKEIEPALRRFKPDLLLISAGFDAHYKDPLASLGFTEDDYVWLTRKLLAVAADCCEGRVVSCLEGGYNLEALAASTAAHVKVLMTT